MSKYLIGNDEAVSGRFRCCSFNKLHSVWVTLFSLWSCYVIIWRSSASSITLVNVRITNIFPHSKDVSSAQLGLGNHCFLSTLCSTSHLTILVYHCQPSSLWSIEDNEKLYRIIVRPQKVSPLPVFNTNHSNFHFYF